MKVIADDDGRLRAIGKRIKDGVNAELIGLLAFRGDGAARFRGAIERAMRTTEGTTIWYLRVIHHLAQNGEVWTLDIAGERMGRGRFPRGPGQRRSARRALGRRPRHARSRRPPPPRRQQARQ